MSTFNIEEFNKLIDKVGVNNLTPEALEVLIKNIGNSDKDENTEKVSPKSSGTKSNKAGIVTRALELEEFLKIIELLKSGFDYENKNGKISYFNPQPNVALALELEATLGLRISDILTLKVSNFQKNKLELLEKKTNKLQYREIDSRISEYIRDYALEHNLGLNDNIISVKTRWIQDRLKIVSKYLGLTNIGTHSFRKFFAMYVYQNSNGDIDLVRCLLNHSTITVTQHYLKTSQKKIDEYSKSVNFLTKDLNE
ncbi:integrase [Clostridium botulinum]|nr:tyrosine-type recombinase/integrase [Clostridium botulinum]MBN1040211.1 integrase [Clostridium botulinum]NFI52300.1 integrase [Clostridium botulinum]HBJ2623063.1 tyrosine-type recombinase/integrase [Clostridium botulinum]